MNGLHCGSKEFAMFSKDNSIQNLLEYARTLGDISMSAAVLAWDQETYMPPKGATVRGRQLSTLAGLFHAKLTDPAFNKLLKTAKPKTKYDQALVREYQKLYTRGTKIPEQLISEFSLATSTAFESWRKAKETNSFKLFKSDLQTVLELRIKIAKLLQTKGQSLYDVMLDEFEPGLTEAEVDKVFSELNPQLILLAKKLAKVTNGQDKKLAKIKFDRKQQWDFGVQIALDMGYNFAAGRQDKSPHPFTITFGINDVRITTWESDTLGPGLFATIHETGHALYEQGVDLILERLYSGESGGLAGGTGLAMHESQSRLWENMIGRSPEFWKTYYPKLQKTFPQLKSLPKDDFVKAINVVRPSLIRVEADEVTYGLHIMARFEIEKDLVVGKIKVADLPKAWNTKYKELLGLTPPTDKLGVLQDVHWAHGSFGYFPTYLLGTIIGAQLINTAQKKIDIFDLPALREWLRKNIHHHGRIYSTNELLLKVTDEPLNPKYYLDYLENKFAKLYNK